MKTFREKIKLGLKSLIYQSETDEPFELVAHEQIDFDKWFAHLTRVEDWFGDEENQTAQNFARFEQMLRKNLTDLSLFKIGAAPRFDYYIVGYDADKKMILIKTSSVET